DMKESARFVDLADQVLERFRPDVLLTYGGHPACLELMRWARMKSVGVVFLLHSSVITSAASLTTSRSRRPAKNGSGDCCAGAEVWLQVRCQLAADVTDLVPSWFS